MIPVVRHVFQGTIWKLLPDPASKTIFVEIRDNVSKKVSFSAVNLPDQTFVADNVVFDEPWWITLSAVAGDLLLLTVYAGENNPDQQGLVAYDVRRRKISWWRNNFSMLEISGAHVSGVDTKTGKRPVVLGLDDGLEASAATFIETPKNLTVIRPFNYREGTANFDTLSAFLRMNTKIAPVISIEYSEYNSFIVLSAFANAGDLANYLFVFNSEGELLFQETLGEHLPGIALETFLIFEGYLIFVKNKRELVSYRMV